MLNDDDVDCDCECDDAGFAVAQHMMIMNDRAIWLVHSPLIQQYLVQLGTLLSNPIWFRLGRAVQSDLGNLVHSDPGQLGKFSPPRYHDDDDDDDDDDDIL